MLLAPGDTSHAAILQRYLVAHQCLNYPQELHHRLSASVDATHVLILIGNDVTSMIDALLAQRSSDERWTHGNGPIGRPQLALMAHHDPDRDYLLP